MSIKRFKRVIVVPINKQIEPQEETVEQCVPIKDTVKRILQKHTYLQKQNYHVIAKIGHAVNIPNKPNLYTLVSMWTATQDNMVGMNG